jgi:sulfatase modifying factor 1
MEGEMKRTSLFLFFLFSFLVLTIFPSLSNGKELAKLAVWDLVPRNISADNAHQLTSILVSEIAKLSKYEVYSQENVRTLAGWTAERMQLGCTDNKCLLALGQMDIVKLISGNVGKIGNRYTVSLNLFDTQNARADNAVSEFCQTENELIELIQTSVRKLLRESVEATSPKAVSAARATPVAYRDPVTGMELVLIKGGCYDMGDTFGDGGVDEKPVHEVCLKDFYLGKNEVTQGQWKRVMGDNPSHFKESDENPVEKISWNDAKEFIRRLNKMSGKSYRLPTEAEWEYAARSGGKREKWAGTSNESELRDYAWFSNNSGNKTHPVRQNRPNGLGLYDMTENVWEWVSDWHDKDYYRSSPKNDPPGPSSGQSKVFRGGSWYRGPGNVRAAYRGKNVPSIRYNSIGFRLAGSPP